MTVNQKRRGGVESLSDKLKLKLPDRCPTCGAAVTKRSIVVERETAEYRCGAELDRYDRGAASVEVSVDRPCPKSPVEIAKRKRRDAIDDAVARTLNRLKATHEECEAFVRRMDMGRYGSRDGIWLKLPSSEEVTS